MLSDMLEAKNVPIKGTTNEVGGMRSFNKSTNTVNESKMLMQSEIFSPLSLGK